MRDLFMKYVYEKSSLESALSDAFEYLGLEMEAKPVPQTSLAHIGIKTIPAGEGHQIVSVYPGSDADAGGLIVGDKIMAINGYFVDNELDRWFDLFKNDQLTIVVNRKGRIVERTLPQTDKNYFLNYTLKVVYKPSVMQAQAFRKWTGLKIEDVA